jgi:cytochrome c-type biogenesis protein CcmH
MSGFPSQFVIPAALLVLLAVAFAISALWQKSRGLAIAIAVVLPLATAGLYAWKGTPAALDAEPAPVAQAPAPDAAAPAADAKAPTPEEVEKLVADLEAKVKAEPGQWEGWALLGRVRMEQERFDDARVALAKAHELVPENDLVGVAYAEALLRANPERRFPPEAVALLERAAKADPPDTKAMFFLGMHKMISGQPGEAADIWESLLPVLEPAAADALKPQIAAARAAAGQSPAPAPTSTGTEVGVTVSLPPEMAANVKPGAVLFVFARAGQGGPPVAVERVAPKSWPVVVTLSDADQAMPTAKLSDHAQVTVAARLSLSGNATPGAGDLESAQVVVATHGASPVALSLDHVRP